MPNQRSPGQKLLNFPADQAFRDILDEGVRVSGSTSRSDFIRRAISERLSDLGLDVPPISVSAPLRLGKGGRKAKHLGPNSSSAPMQINEVVDASFALSKKMIARERRRAAKF